MTTLSRSIPISVYSTTTLSVPKSATILDIIPDLYNNDGMCLILECDAEDTELKNIEIIRVYYNYIVPDGARYLGTIVRDNMEVYYIREL